MSSNEIASPERLDELRILIRSQSGALAAKHFDQFAASMTSREDAELMHRYIRGARHASEACTGVLALYTMGGVGEIAADVRQHVINDRDELNYDIDATVPLILWKCATQLFDVNAIRCLLEFGDRASFREFVVELENRRLTLPYPQCLTFTRKQQADYFLKDLRQAESVRTTFLARNYADVDSVNDAIVSLAEAGSVPALTAVFFRQGALSWDLFHRTKPNDQSEERMTVNLIVENLRRGASFAEVSALARKSAVVARSLERLDLQLTLSHFASS